MQDSNGTTSTEVSFKAEKKVTDDISYSIDVSTTIKHDKGQGPVIQMEGVAKIDGTF